MSNQTMVTKMEREAYVKGFEPNKSSSGQFFERVSRTSGIKVKAATIQSVCQIISRDTGLICPSKLADFRIWRDDSNSYGPTKSGKGYNVFLLGKHYTTNRHGSLGKVSSSRSPRVSSNIVAKWISAQTNQKIDIPQKKPAAVPRSHPPQADFDIVPCLVDQNGKVITGRGCRFAYLVKQQMKSPIVVNAEPIVPCNFPTKPPVDSDLDTEVDVSPFNFIVATKKHNISHLPVI